ncbi:MAG: site-specific integrase [Oligoflexia bacterium]|nr:site-specific integrase [Oligoflexia bacterium]
METIEKNNYEPPILFKQNADYLLSLEKEFFNSLVLTKKSANTIKNYRTDLNCFNQFLEKRQHLPCINNFGLQQVEEYAYFLEERYTSTNSRRRRVQTLRIFFDFLLSKTVVRENPVKKISPCPKFLDVPRPASLEHIQTMFTYLKNESVVTTSASTVFPSLLACRNLVIVMLIYGQGLKVSELSQLQKRHLFLGKGPRVMINPPKRDPYTIPLQDVFVQVYNQYQKLFNRVLKEQKIVNPKSNANLNNNNIHNNFDSLLFNANHYRILAGGLSPRGLEIIFEDLKKKLNIEITPKSLRQACIFKWIAQKHPSTQIKEWLGVAPTYSLEPYLKLSSKNSYNYNDNFIYQLFLDH